MRAVTSRSDSRIEVKGRGPASQSSQSQILGQSWWSHFGPSLWASFKSLMVLMVLPVVTANASDLPALPDSRTCRALCDSID